MDNFSHFFMQQKILLKKSTILNQFKHGSRIERNYCSPTTYANYWKSMKRGLRYGPFYYPYPLKSTFTLEYALSLTSVHSPNCALKDKFSVLILLVFFSRPFSLNLQFLLTSLGGEKSPNLKKKIKYILYIKKLIHKSTL